MVCRVAPDVGGGLREKTIHYRGKNITVGFNPDRCTHVAECLRSLPDVFDNSRRPWIDPDAASADAVAEVIVRCPTGALHFMRTDGGPEEPVPEENVILVSEDGPYFVKGDVEIRSPDGNLQHRDTRIALCRCGASQHKPFCDGRHFFVDFEDSGALAKGCPQPTVPPRTETALTVTLPPKGPLPVSGPFTLRQEFSETGIRGTRISLCRCGASKTKPCCDGSHIRIGA